MPSVVTAARPALAREGGHLSSDHWGGQSGPHARGEVWPLSLAPGLTLRSVLTPLKYYLDVEPRSRGPSPSSRTTCCRERKASLLRSAHAKS